MNVKLQKMWGSAFAPLFLSFSCAHLDPDTVSPTKFASSREQELTSKNVSRSQIIRGERVKTESIGAWRSKVCESLSGVCPSVPRDPQLFTAGATLACSPFAVLSRDEATEHVDFPAPHALVSWSNFI